MPYQHSLTSKVIRFNREGLILLQSTVAGNETQVHTIESEYIQ